jgi:type I restriction enzyme S subunit
MTIRDTKLPKGWVLKSLKDICAINPPKREAKEKLHDFDLVTFLPMEDLGIEPKSVNGTKEKLLKDVAGSYTYFAENDVLLAKITPCFENGKIGIAKKLKNGIGFGSSEFLVFRPKELLTSEYLCYFLSQCKFREEGAKLMTGAVGHKRVSKDWIENYPLPFPESLPEQQRIVGILEQTFEAIEKAKANAERNLKNARDVFESYLQGVFEKKGTDWEIRTLGDENLIEIIDGDRGKNYPTQKDFLDEGFCLFMNTKNVRPDGFKFDTTMFISEAKDMAMGKGKLKRSDVVMTTRGTIGNIGIFNSEVKFDNIRINSGMLIFRPNQKQISSEYLFEILRSGIIKTQIKKHVSGAAQPQLPIKTLINFTIPVPKLLTEQQLIVSRLKSLSSETQRLEAIYQQKLINLEELKKSVLEKAFKGEL